MIIKDLYNAYQAGQSLSNPEGWKRGSELSTKIGVVLIAIVATFKYFYPDIDVPNDYLQYLVDSLEGIIGAVLVGINLYISRATTKKDVAAAELPKEIAVIGQSIDK